MAMPPAITPEQAPLVARLRELYGAVPSYGRGRRTAGAEGAAVAAEIWRLRDAGVPMKVIGAALGLTSSAARYILATHHYGNQVAW